jgi:hypothetical protein
LSNHRLIYLFHNVSRIIYRYEIISSNCITLCPIVLSLTSESEVRVHRHSMLPVDVLITSTLTLNSESHDRKLHHVPDSRTAGQPDSRTPSGIWDTDVLQLEAQLGTQSHEVGVKLEAELKHIPEVCETPYSEVHFLSKMNEK